MGTCGGVGGRYGGRWWGEPAAGEGRGTMLLPRGFLVKVDLYKVYCLNLPHKKSSFLPVEFFNSL